MDGLLRRVFEVDVLQSPGCGGRMSVIATIEAYVLRKMLGHLGLPTDPQTPLAASSASFAAGPRP